MRPLPAPPSAIRRSTALSTGTNGDLSTTYYDALGPRTELTIDYASGAHLIGYYGLTGSAYAGEETSLDSFWHQAGQVLFHDDGSIYGSSSIRVDADGDVTTSQFDATGALTSVTLDQVELIGGDFRFV